MFERIAVWWLKWRIKVRQDDLKRLSTATAECWREIRKITKLLEKLLDSLEQRNVQRKIEALQLERLKAEVEQATGGVVVNVLMRDSCVDVTVRLPK
jgi:uncharacterized coiled-coil protein SlyX